MVSSSINLYRLQTSYLLDLDKGFEDVDFIKWNELIINMISNVHYSFWKILYNSFNQIFINTSKILTQIHT